MDQRKEGRITVATLKISDILRTDDGLYKCLASNQRTRSKKVAFKRMGYISRRYGNTRNFTLALFFFVLNNF